MVAERISHAVETYGLLPTNHFGARKQRSAEQALLLLQEQVYAAWRGRRIVSLVSFDVKGAYNGVCKERLLQRMRARGIPEDLLRWVEAFCSDRTASIQINGQTSETRSLPQAGLPQGSPLSPILFLFFNADLVQRRIDCYGGAIAFVDDFTAWVTGPTAQANREGIEAIIKDATEWEKRSGATFEAEKTAIIHFTRKPYKSDTSPFSIKGQAVQPQEHVKILGVVMDTRLKYVEHIAKAATKALEAAMELKRLRGLTPVTARQLFTATVAPVFDYASNVWMHALNYKTTRAVNRFQRLGAQAVVVTFATVATSVAEAEAHIATAPERLWRRAIKIWTDIHTLPETNPLRRATIQMRKFRRYHRSPFYQVAEALKEVSMEKLETIGSFTIAPWQTRTQSLVGKAMAEQASSCAAVRVAVSSSARNGIVGAGGAIEIHRSAQSERKIETFSTTIGMREGQNPYSGEIGAIARALGLLPKVRFRRIIVLTRNKAAVLAIGRPRQQSGQEYIQSIYETVNELRRRGNTTTIVWRPTSEEDELLQLAKEKAKLATRQGAIPEITGSKMRSTTLNLLRKKRDTVRRLPDNVGKHSKRVDAALPGKHTRQLYDQLSWKEASVLAQLRTGIARLNSYLFHIEAATSDQCACGQARETVEHFLFRCIKWKDFRREMLQCTEDYRSNISYYLGGKSPSDGKGWKPNMEAVKATIRFAMATGRLDARPEQEDTRTY